MLRALVERRPISVRRVAFLGLLALGDVLHLGRRRQRVHVGTDAAAALPAGNRTATRTGRYEAAGGPFMLVFMLMLVVFGLAAMLAGRYGAACRTLGTIMTVVTVLAFTVDRTTVLAFLGFLRRILRATGVPFRLYAAAHGLLGVMSCSAHDSKIP